MTCHALLPFARRRIEIDRRSKPRARRPQPPDALACSWRPARRLLAPHVQAAVRELGEVRAAEIATATFQRSVWRLGTLHPCEKAVVEHELAVASSK